MGIVLQTGNRPLARAGIISLHALVFSSLSISGAFAAAPAALDPAQLEQRFEQPRNEPTVTPKVVPVVTPTPKLSKEAQTKLAKQRVTVKSVTIEGNTIFSNDALKSTYQDKIGKEISLLEAQAIPERITDMYRNSGYILSQAVLQSSAGGNLKIRVVEGYIYNVIINGDIRESGSRSLVAGYAEQIKKKRPISIADLERYLLLMDDLPGATAKGVVRPSSQPGAADLVVTFAHKAFDGSYSMDNRGSKFVGPIQHTATLSANSLFNLYDRTILRFIAASPTTELRFFDLQHEEQLGHEGTRLMFDASHSVSEPGDALKNVFHSESDFFQARVEHPFERSRQSNLVGHTLFDVRNSDTDLIGGANVSTDRLRSLRLGGSYDFVDSYAGANLINLEGSQGLNIFNASSSGIERSRTDGESNYTKVNLDLARTQALPDNFSLLASASSQYSFSRLLAAEQFAIGGPIYGQGYDPAELTGDTGVAGKVEMRYGEAVGNMPMLQSYQLYGFYDIGRVWYRDVAPGVNDKKSLASTGLGVRANFNPYLSGDVQMAVPMTKDPINQGSRESGDPRFFFSVTGRF